MADTDDNNTFHQDRVKVTLGPKLTYSKLLALLAANRDKQVITVGPKEYENITGTIQDQPNTEIDGENASEEGNTLDGPETDDDHLRRRLYKYKMGESTELTEGTHVVHVFVRGRNKPRRETVTAANSGAAIERAEDKVRRRGFDVIRAVLVHSKM